MIKTNKNYPIAESMKTWKVISHETKVLYAQPDFRWYDTEKNEFHNIDGFYCTTSEDEDERTYFYLDCNYMFLFEDGEKKIIALPTDTRILTYCPSMDKYFQIAIDEENETLYIYN